MGRGPQYHGTWASDEQLLSSYNYSDDRFEGSGSLTGWLWRPIWCVTGPAGRARCTARQRFASRLGPTRGRGSGETPGVRAARAWGPKVGLADPEALIYLSHLCDLVGVDSVSAGNAVAFAIDLYQRGVLSASEQADSTSAGATRWRWSAWCARWRVGRVSAASLDSASGAPLRSSAAARRGTRSTSRAIELSAYDPRVAHAAGLTYTVSTRGGDFTGGFPRHEKSMTAAEARVRLR